MLYLLFHVSDRMVSLNLCGRGRSAVRNGHSQTLLPLNQEPSSFYCSQRKLLTLSLTRKRKKKRFVSGFFFLHFSASVSTLFLHFQLCISFVYVWICPFSFLVQEQHKKNLACCLSASVCFAEALLDEGHSRDWLWIALLWKASLCCSSMRGEIIVQYR